MAGRAGRLIAAAAAILLAAAAGPAAPGPTSALAGRYSSHFRNGAVDGSTYWSDDVVEIVPVDAGHAYVRFALHFYNGHECSLAGVAAAEGDALVYRDTPADRSGVAGRCTLPIRRKGDRLAWNDADGGCHLYCGARGGFGNGSLAWSSRRPITYLARLRASSTYRDALRAWQAGAPAH